MSTTANGSLNVKQAVSSCANYLRELLPQVESVRVEEVELSPDDASWFITLGYLLPRDEDPTIVPAITPRKRNYRIFEVNREQGVVRSMKIREPLYA